MIYVFGRSRWGFIDPASIKITFEPETISSVTNNNTGICSINRFLLDNLSYRL